MDKHWMYPIFILVLTVLTLSLCGTCLSASPKLPIQNHQDAINIANQVSGFDKLPNFSEIAITVQKVVVVTDNTVLYQWIEGRSFWKVSYCGVVVSSKDEERNPYINAFDVWVDVETGQVPKIASQWMPGINLKYRMLEADRVAHIRDIISRLDDPKKRERYRVPEQPPQISFLECLKSFVAEAGSGDSGKHHDKRIVAVYKWDAAARYEEVAIVPVWTLTGFGGEYFFYSVPEESPGSETPTDDVRVQKHMIIDAVTGEILATAVN